MAFRSSGSLKTSARRARANSDVYSRNCAPARVSGIHGRPHHDRARTVHRHGHRLERTGQRRYGIRSRPGRVQFSLLVGWLYRTSALGRSATCHPALDLFRIDVLSVLLYGEEVGRGLFEDHDLRIYGRVQQFLAGDCDCGIGVWDQLRSPVRGRHRAVGGSAGNGRTRQCSLLLPPTLFSR